MKFIFLRVISATFQDIITVEVIPQTNTLGAEIRGVDLSEPVSDELLQQINQAFLDYQVIYFRDQQLSHQQYTDFAQRFGPLRDYLFADGIEGYPYITEIIKTESESASFGGFWHSDSAYLELPPKITLLYARQIPPQGGDTLFSDMYSVYRDLSDGLKSTLEPLNAVNSASAVDRGGRNASVAWRGVVSEEAVEESPGGSGLVTKPAKEALGLRPCIIRIGQDEEDHEEDENWVDPFWQH